ncbi:MAG TPA: A/G-specific adenine glycosylase [Thermoanaerobaculia bacterium]|nr:A/G-specific adenine glycosylase [Thermoanaerobaculia bacterium]
MLAADLLLWFDRHRRDLPWRRRVEPYRVWVSEIMLQQTRVEVAIPYYDRFLSRFPTVETLAAAEIDEVLALWSGLGYYRRARQLHAAAAKVVEKGGFPRTEEGLLELPGIGPYTAAAIASICFAAVTPVLDGNVERVVARFLAAEGDVKSAAVRRRLRATAAAFLDPLRPGDSNQALMELGAMVCLPRRPRCLLCPLAPDCAAVRRGDPESFPRARRQRSSEVVEMLAALIEDREGRILLFRRPDASVLLAGIWEVPWIEKAAGDPEAELARRYGGAWRLGARIGRARHGITFRDLRVEVRRAELLDAGEVREGAEVGWFSAEELSRLATSSLLGKILSGRDGGRGDGEDGEKAGVSRARRSRPRG